MKGKTSSSSSKMVAKTVTKVATVRARVEKKVYTLPGQKHDPPEEVFVLLFFFFVLLVLDMTLFLFRWEIISSYDLGGSS